MWQALVDRETGFRLFSPELLQTIAQSRVLLAGLGGNGSVADLLVRAGFTNFVLIDPDVVEKSNLNRLPFGRDALGLPKTEAWQRHLSSINPEIRVETWQKGVTRHDGAWLTELVRGAGKEKPIDLVFLGTTDVEANLVVGRVCAQTKTRMLIGPASSGCWIVGTFLHKDGDVTLESLGGFGTEALALEDIDYQALRPRYLKVMNYPGRASRLQAGVWEAMCKGSLEARSCGIFVRMTNAAMAFEAVKNIADINAFSLEGTKLTTLPRLQIFDPYVGASYYYDCQKQLIGIPNWLSGEIRWQPWQADHAKHA
ncbi:MAG: ThiF family adenylyltransferase [Desulfovibrio sp.]|nr:ThiF family adenylyltransferase [Desulfovibrio sp.]